MFFRISKNLLIVSGLVVWFFCAASIQGATNSIDKLTAATYFAAGLEQVKIQNYKAATLAFINCLKIDSKNSDAFLNLGACYERMGKFKIGQQYYRQALKLTPQDAEINYLYGSALVRNGKPNEGLKLIETAVYLDPKKIDYIFNLGIAYSEHNQKFKANNCFKRVYQTITNNSTVSYYYGLSSFILGHTNMAVKLWREVEIDSLYMPDVKYNLAALELANKEYKNCVANLQWVLKIEPQNERARLLLAECYAEMGGFKTATIILSEMLKNQRAPQLQLALSKIYLEWGDQVDANDETKLALDKYLQALVYAPTSPLVHLKLSQIYYKLGQFKETKKENDLLLSLKLNKNQEKEVRELIEKTQKALDKNRNKTQKSKS